MLLKSQFNSCCLTVVLTLPKGTGAQKEDGKGAVFSWTLTNITSCSQLSVADIISVVHHKAQSSEDLQEPPQGRLSGLVSLGKST